MKQQDGITHEETKRGEKQTRHFFPRRTALKIIGGLFAFIPAARYLSNTSPAFADDTCMIRVRIYLGRVCADPNRTGKRTWWDAWEWVDPRDHTHCSYENKDIGIPC